MASSTESGAKKQPMCPTCVGLELLTEDEIRQSMATRPLWGLKAGGGGSDSGASNNTKEERPVMERAFVAKNFQAINAPLHVSQHCTMRQCHVSGRRSYAVKLVDACARGCLCRLQSTSSTQPPRRARP